MDPPGLNNTLEASMDPPGFSLDAAKGDLVPLPKARRHYSGGRLLQDESDNDDEDCSSAELLDVDIPTVIFTGKQAHVAPLEGIPSSTTPKRKGSKKGIISLMKSFSPVTTRSKSPISMRRKR